MVSTKIGFPSLSAKARGLSGLSPSGLERAGPAKNGFERAGFRARPETRPSLLRSISSNQLLKSLLQRNIQWNIVNPELGFQND